MLRFLALAAAWSVIWSGAFVATKIAIADAGPLATVAIRTCAAGLILVAVAWRSSGGVPREGLRGLIIVGVLNNAGYLGLIAAALPHVSVGMAAILTSMIPIIVLVISALRGTALRAVQWAGAGLGLAGVVGSAVTRLGSGFTTPTGIAIGLIAVFCLVAGTVLTPRLVPAGNPWMSTGVQSLAGGLPLAVAAVAVGVAGRPLHMTPSFLAAAAYLIVVASVVGMTLWLHIIREFGPERAAVAHFLPPIVSIGLGALILGENPTPLAVAMCVPVAAGVYLATKPPSRHNTRP